ncbi:MAG: TauD/TfdA family dioxygenase [Kutzneria sp.]|nr:TauD/TfdA family dioxygenase [Kutzneria sp.]
MTRGQSTTLVISAEAVEAIEKIWTDQRIDDAQLREPKAQDALRQRWANHLGITWSELVDNVHSTLCAQLWVIVHSPIGRPSPALLAALGTAVGRLTDPYRASWSRVLQEIPHKSKWTPDLEWHTDSTGWPQPNDVTALTCLKAAAIGGATDLLTLNTVQRAGVDEATLTTLVGTVFAWPLDAELGGGHTSDVIVTPGRIRFMRAALLNARDGRIRDSARQFADVIDQLAPDYSAALDPGDTLLFNNTRCLHRRGELFDPDRQRLLLRTKIFWHARDGLHGQARHRAITS